MSARYILGGGDKRLPVFGPGGHPVAWIDNDDVDPEEAARVAKAVVDGLNAMPAPIPTRVEFTYYLHDSRGTGEMWEAILHSVKKRGEVLQDLPAELEEKIGRYTFSEIALDCVLDTLTGDIRIKGLA